MAALAFFAAGPLVSLFNRDGDPALQQMAEQGLRLYFLGFPFAGLNLVTASFLGAAEHPSRSLRLSLLRGFVAIVAAALLLAALLGLKMCIRDRCSSWSPRWCGRSRASWPPGT